MAHLKIQPGIWETPAPGAGLSLWGREPPPLSFRWTILHPCASMGTVSQLPAAASIMHPHSSSFSFPILLPSLPHSFFQASLLGLFPRLCVWETQTRIVPNIADCCCEKHDCNFPMALRCLCDRASLWLSYGPGWGDN